MIDIQYIRIVLTQKCNMKCKYCHHEGCNTTYNNLEYDKLINTLKIMYEIGYRKFKLMGGEPMLYPKIKNLVFSIRNIANDIDLSMISNGTANIDQYMELFNLGLNRLNFSVHGWKHDVFTQNTGLSKRIVDKIKENIYNLYVEGKINKLNYVLQKGKNEDDFYEFIEYIKNFKLIIDVLNVLYSHNELNLAQYKYSFSEIENFIVANWNIVDKKIVNNKYSLPSKRLYISDGCVINLKTTQLNSQNIFKSCKKCDYHQYCTEGIKAIRLNNNGFLQPCLLRTDNMLNLNRINNKNDIVKYLENL